MKVSSLSNINIGMVNFRAGKTGLYTDFDGTYFPFHQEILENQEEPLFSQAARMYDAFSKFINKGKEKFKVIITTGRSLIEMQNVLNFLEKSNLPFPQQKNYILRNGLEEIEAADEGHLKSTKAAQLTESFPSEVKNIVISSFDNIFSLELSIILSKFLIFPAYVNLSKTAILYSGYLLVK